MLYLLEWLLALLRREATQVSTGVACVITALVDCFYFFPLSLLSLALTLPVLAFIFLKWGLLSRKQAACSVGQLPILFGPKLCSRADLCSHTELPFPGVLGDTTGILWPQKLNKRTMSYSKDMGERGYWPRIFMWQHKKMEVRAWSGGLGYKQLFLWKLWLFLSREEAGVTEQMAGAQDSFC